LYVVVDRLQLLKISRTSGVCQECERAWQGTLQRTGLVVVIFAAPEGLYAGVASWDECTRVLSIADTLDLGAIII